jgi:hypothetical protein
MVRNYHIMRTYLSKNIDKNQSPLPCNNIPVLSLNINLSTEKSDQNVRCVRISMKELTRGVIPSCSTVEFPRRCNSWNEKWISVLRTWSTIHVVGIVFILTSSARLIEIEKRSKGSSYFEITPGWQREVIR